MDIRGNDDIRIIFFDVDGTLVGINHQVAIPSTLSALQALREKGIIICISSGRHLLDVKVLDLPPFDAYITTNGACCIANNKVIYKRLIPEEDIERLIRYQQGKNKFPCIIETADEAYLNFSNKWVKQLHKELHIRKPILCSFDEWSTQARSGVEQMLCFFSPKSDERLIKEILPGCATKRWCFYFTDVIENECDKAKGIDIILDHFGLQPKHAMAFGDGGNDISMLEHVGISVAMGNASEQVKASADFITNSVENDGILKGLQHFGVLD